MNCSDITRSRLQSFYKIRLKTALVFPFILQITIAVGLVGYFSFKNGQKAVENLAQQLIESVSVRIENHVLEYFNKSFQVLRITEDNVKAGTLDLNDFEGLKQYFWNVVAEGDLESYLSYGNEQGEFIGVEHLETNQVQLKIRTLETEPMREVYRLDEWGNRAEFLKQAEYDPRQRPWYQAAKQAQKPTWSSIYPFFSRQNTDTALGMSAVWPVFDQDRNLQGVLCINITLLRITYFLKNLYISPHGQSFIIERSGDLVVSSKIEKTFQITGKGEDAKIQRFPANKSEDITIRNTANALLKKFGSFVEIQNSEQVKFQQNRQWYYAQILPIKDGRGINWLVVVVVPEADFMTEIKRNTQITIGLCLIALGWATGIGILTARWITKPISRLNQASHKMAKGELNQQVKVGGIKELETLANSFNWMAGQLKESFDTLEEKVKKRTGQLAEANQEISSLNTRLKAENLRMGAELDILREMQQLILPKPHELEEIQDLDIVGYMEPADEIGGDYYDVLTTHGVVTIGIGDVTGHGLESGILMVMIQSAVRTLKEVKEHDPIKFLNTLNRMIYYNIQRMNSDKNLTLAILNYSEGLLSISGQHEEILIVRQGGNIERISTMDLGLPIGLDEDIAEFISHTLISLNSGDGAVLYTDGITEAKNRQKKFYGLEKLCSIISQNWYREAEGIKNAVIEDVKSFMGEQKQFDDITLLVIKKK
ncbi:MULTISPECIES: SpoIIE family protein phosphatase [Planktothrix]|jgi:sigma-B regulation protein RsbU (phosphoserine phosphatase)|uniref:Protein serine/threonine phosphatase with Cache sensor n=1 Tax=Planktothrix rubescens CCAP 1459/22 TaxID=329571 RepID=A0A6J7ZMT8_PLARU|nr:MULTISPECIES: SpoIIE family protein phosphatase [Planktothrix]CAC5343301.1 Protein serine/threonine phosphatase with Cache sensor [Planktothrix rubescens NIVA-CYA 18]CAD5965299.1 Protein IcfG [Planktothrix rubescens]CAD5978414.1 Protein IcfG [Planktothrix rubescens NIVA-CYA 18]